MTNNNDIKIDIGTRLKKGNNCYYALSKYSNSNVIWKNVKIQISNIWRFRFK